MEGEIVYSLKKNFRKLVRTAIKCKENERIADAIDRHKTKILRFIYPGKIKDEDIKKELLKMGIKNGDIIMVHSSWRKFFNYEGNPKSLIKLLIEIIGTEGTLLMPCFGTDKRYFDVNKTPSYAGVLSEEFRKMPGVLRSECSHFSVCGYGKQAKKLLEKHALSCFGFDYNSPYYIFSQMEGAKIIKFGMGKYPIKLTLIHCIEYVYKDKFPYFRDYLTLNYEATVIDNEGNKTKRQMIEGIGGKLYHKNIKKVYKNIPSNLFHYSRISNIDICVFDAKAGYNEIVKLVESGKSMLKPPKVTKESFIPLK
ncbi:AAC(3) family N-acetyltransferase [Peptoclostridium sp.]|uniref:AAC(3) family N-acetyltransferase n=1 Tax=Peptoclostridium sp. TaxID=1904860 RepID=UPI0025F790A1|nr:AAC(3) family N-acetyltransferase [Peptoclostridium sp.]